MGVAIREIVAAKPTDAEQLRGKTLVFDTFNLLYQFLTTIRQRDGSPLTDRNGRVTSHLAGMFSRTAYFLEKGILPVFVFDGTPPALKKGEIENRRRLKEGAQASYTRAAQEGDEEAMRKYAPRTARLTDEMIGEAKQMASYLGCPVVQAPSEGEAQAAHIVRQGGGYATVSQDFDTLLHGSPLLVRNLSVTGRKKVAGRLATKQVEPEIVSLSENLNALGIDNDQLIALAMLVGTDYNPGGVKGIGPKKALSLVKKHGKDFDELFSQAGWEADVPWTEVYYLIKNMPVTSAYSIERAEIDAGKVREMLCGEYGFSEERVEKTLAKFEVRQKGLSEFF